VVSFTPLATLLLGTKGKKNWVDLRARMNTVNKRKVSVPTRNKTSDSMVIQPEAYSKRYLSSQINM
jgi:hypothetical protein